MENNFFLKNRKRKKGKGFFLGEIQKGKKEGFF